MAIKCKRCVHLQEGARSIIFVRSRKWFARWGSGRGRGVGGMKRVRGPVVMMGNREAEGLGRGGMME